MKISPKTPLTAALLALLLCTAAVAAEPTPKSVLQVDVGPTRVWHAFKHQVAADGRSSWHGNEQRFEAILNLPEAPEVELSVGWDETSGGTRLTWQPTSPAIEHWMAQLAVRATTEKRDNYLCGGDHSRPEDLPEASIAGTLSCGGGGGQRATTLLELEKCGDYESALRVLAACVRERHGGGLIRLAWFFENGLGVPRRLEEMTRYLRLASESSTPGYRDKATVQYATALYFGIGNEVDREKALRLFRQAAAVGETDAILFLQHGYSTAWRRQDGSFYADANWPHTPVEQ